MNSISVRPGIWLLPVEIIVQILTEVLRHSLGLRLRLVCKFFSREVLRLLCLPINKTFLHPSQLRNLHFRQIFHRHKLISGRLLEQICLGKAPNPFLQELIAVINRVKSNERPGLDEESSLRVARVVCDTVSITMSRSANNSILQALPSALASNDSVPPSLQVKGIPLALAAALGMEDLVTTLMDDTRTDLTHDHPVFGNAMQAAAYQGQDNVVKLLIGKGFKVKPLYEWYIGDYDDEDDPWAFPQELSPLDFAARAGHVDTLKQLLLPESLPFQLDSWSGRFWVRHAAAVSIYNFQLHSLEFLVPYLNFTDDQGVWQPYSQLAGALGIAARNGAMEIARFLFDKFAKTIQHDTFNCLVRRCSFCRTISSFMCQAALRSHDILEYILSCGYNPDLFSRDHRARALDCAEQLRSIKLIHEFGGNLSTNIDRRLASCARRNDMKALEYFMLHACELDANALHRPLCAAVYASTVEIAQRLVNAGADPHRRGGYYTGSPLEIALKRGNMEMAQMFQQELENKEQ
ncbi:ankyrin [Microthyrium microscopicum]|uniref:Ankyrin n=1 Tax=Microthyrium microscopicum TaxID=703497 RepID=A0A6A6U950_9PEZI|nr:ankyrin [Microthyrium microscopicum]